MKQVLTILSLALVGIQSVAVAQKKLPEYSIQKSQIEGHLRFLASDELEGRRTGEQSNRVAARYIAEQLRRIGVTTVPGQTSYLQPVMFEKTHTAKKGTLIANHHTVADTISTAKEWLYLSGNKIDATAPVVYAAYGQASDFKDLDVKGKIVLTQSGLTESQSPREHLAAAVQKRKLAAEKGAIALIELYTGTTPFDIVKNALSGERVSLLDEKSTPLTLPHIWVNGKEAKITRSLREAQSVTVANPGRKIEPVLSYNVAGYIEGTDPKLKDEYVLISAHFDHVGVGKQGGQPYSAADSIFNGARDNAFGTSAILTAAEAIMKKKTKRSILFVAFTGEELGLLGSKYYVNNPLMPLNKCIFNMNNDGAGYNDTSIISVFGFERTGATKEITKAAKTFGLDVFGDPAPEQNLFDRSDNVSFAAKGIPAPTFTPGFKEFDAEIMKYYHQAIDNPDTIDFDYMLKYVKAYTYVVRMIANNKETPKWTPGDKYEAASKALYGK